MSNRLAAALVILAAVIAAVTAWHWGVMPQRPAETATESDPHAEGIPDD